MSSLAPKMAHLLSRLINVTTRENKIIPEEMSALIPKCQLPFQSALILEHAWS